MAAPVVAHDPESPCEFGDLRLPHRERRAEGAITGSVRAIEVTSYAEIVLGRPEDDLAHPAFGKLFVETEHASQSAGLLFSRRPRSAEEETLWAFHVLGVEGRLGGAVEWETDRLPSAAATEASRSNGHGHGRPLISSRFFRSEGSRS